MTGYELTYSLGNIRAANTDTLLKPFEIRGASKYGVMALHGATTQDEFAVADRWKSAKIAAHVAMAGIPVVAGRMSGDSFANDFAMPKEWLSEEDIKTVMETPQERFDAVTKSVMPPPPPIPNEAVAKGYQIANEAGM